MTHLVSEVGGHHGQVTSKSVNEQMQQSLSTSTSTSTVQQQSSSSKQEMSSSMKAETSSSAMMTSSSSDQQQFSSSSMTTGGEQMEYSLDNAASLSLQRGTKTRLRGGKLETVPDEYLYAKGIKIVSTSESLSELEKNLAKGPDGAVVISSSSKSGTQEMSSSSSAHAMETVQQSSRSEMMSDSKTSTESSSFYVTDQQQSDLKSSDSTLISKTNKSLNTVAGLSSDQRLRSEDSSSMRKLVRGPGTTKRILRGGKMESVFVEGDVLGYEDELATFHQSLYGDSSSSKMVTDNVDVSQSGYTSMQQNIYSSESTTNNQGTTKSRSEFAQSTSEGRHAGGDGEILTKSKTVVYDSGAGPSPYSTSHTSRTVLRGGKVVNVSEDHVSSDVSESQRLIQQSSDDLKQLGQFTTTSKTSKLSGQETTKQQKSSTQTSKLSESMIQSMSENIDTSSSSIITEQIARQQQQLDSNRIRGEYRGSRTETVTGGTTHDFGDVKGLTVVTHSKSSMEQTEDQKLAQAQLQSLTQSSSVYGVNIESSLRGARVKEIQEREISRGIVRLSDLGLETTENVEKSITEIKSAKVSDTVEIDERIESKTTSSDIQTFRYEEMSESERRNALIMRNQRNRVTGSAMIEDTYDVSTKFDSRDKYDKITTAVEDERHAATTFLEQVDNKNQVLDTTYIVYPRQTPIRREDNLRVEDSTSSTNYLSTNRSDYDEKRSSTTRGIRRNTFTKTEGDMSFETTAKSEYYEKSSPGERPTMQRQNTWTKMEGDMQTTTTSKEQFRTVKGERSTPILHKDNLHPEGPFYGKVREEAPKADRVKPMKYVDNLRPEGKSCNVNAVSIMPQLSQSLSNQS